MWDNMTQLKYETKWDKMRQKETKWDKNEKNETIYKLWDNRRQCDSTCDIKDNLSPYETWDKWDTTLWDYIRQNETK